jgi:putative transposase
VQTVQREVLDHFIVLGEKHLDYLVREFLEYYHEHRPHQGKGNVPLTPQVEAPPNDEPFRLRDVACKQRLGGLLKHYYRKAA